VRLRRCFFNAPAPVLKRLHAGLAATMDRPDIKTQMAAQATEILITAPAQFREIVRATIEDNLKMSKALNLSVDR